MLIPTEQQFNNAKVDLDDLEVIVNGSSTVTTRLGGGKLSVDQALSQIITGEVTVYNAATTYTGIEEWVEFTGVVYRPLPSALPIGPEVFNAANWSPTNSNNADNVEYNSTTVGDYLDNQNVADYAALTALLTSNEYGVGNSVVVAYRDDSTKVANSGGRFLIALASDFTAAIASDPQQGVYVQGGTLVAIRAGTTDTVFDVWFGANNDWDGATGTDNAPAVNGAIQFCKDNLSVFSTVIATAGRFAIESPIKQRSGVNFYGAGSLGSGNGGTEYVCNYSADTIATPPTDGYVGTYSPVFDYTPMIYNVDLMSQTGFGGFRFNGNNKDVYGIYENEYYFMRTRPIFVIACNKSPYTCLVGQSNVFGQLTLNNNKAGARFVRCSTTYIDILDTEVNLISGGSQLDIISDSVASTKTAITVGTWHYEETATDFPDILARLSGRNICIQNASINTNGTPALRYIELLGAVAYAFDGINITTTAAAGTDLLNLSFLAATGTVRFNAGCVGAYVNTSSTAQVVDDSGNTTNQTDGINDAPTLPRDSRILNSTGGNALSFPDDNTVTFGSNSNRKLELSGADWNMENAGGRINITASTDLHLTVSQFMRITGLPTSTAGLPSNTLWNDSGTVKIT